MEKHYTLSKAAEILGVTTQTLRNWDNAGKICAIRTPGNQRRIPESEISRLLNPEVDNIANNTEKPQRSTGKSQENIEKLPTIATKDDENYLLMCKDVAVYDITHQLVLDESLLPGCMLKETMDFSQWMQTRYSEQTNFSAQRLMQSAFGKIDHIHAAFATGAHSLSDCYWIKQKDENINFMDITPYIHKEWDDVSENGAQNEYIWGPLSSLFVGGKTDKVWLDALSLLKINSFNEIEPYRLCSLLGLENIAKAKNTDDGIILRNFTSTDVFFESMKQYGITKENTDSRDVAIDSFKEHAVALFVIDYLVENNDRQPDDYGFLRCSNTGEYISMAPYYNFDWIWSGDSIKIPDIAWQRHSEYIYSLCRRAISVAGNFEYGTIIERRARELLLL